MHDGTQNTESENKTKPIMQDMFLLSMCFVTELYYIQCRRTLRLLQTFLLNALLEFEISIYYEQLLMTVQAKSDLVR